jgi:ATP-dependent DNA helicase RecQ
VVRGNMKNMNFSDLNVSLPTAFRMKASGTLQNLDNPDRLKADVDVDAHACNASFLKELMPKDLRKDVARKLRLQPWVIFGDPSLEDMSIMYPVTIEELKNYQGVGEGKAKKFGKEFLNLIAKYVEENDITRPDDFVMKSIVNKSVNKVYIIQSVDRKLPLEDIADTKGMDMEELLSEIEAIVYSGTKLNRNYYIEQNLEDDVVDKIYDYFKEEAESDSLADAMEELGSDYDEVEVRLVRIKFLCEVAN